MISQHDIQSYKYDNRILQRGDTYLYLLPHPALRAYISNYTITFPTPEIMTERYTIMPDGSATLVLACENNVVSAFVYGPSAVPETVGSSPFELLIITEFQPAGFHALTGIKQHELANILLPLDSISPVLNQSITEIAEKANTVHELARGLDHVYLQSMCISQNALLQLATHNIIASAGNVSLKALSAEVHYSERHINRMFTQTIGVNVKVFSRLVRLNNACRMLENDKNSITAISAALGFYDLQHFNHDFQLLSGVSPQAYRSNMSDFYHAIAKF